MRTTFDLMVAPNGAKLSQKDHRSVPITASEIAQTAKACADAGATAIHVHVRDDDGRHCLDPARYAQTVEEISKLTSLPVQFSTESAGRFDVAAQRHCLAHPSSPDASVSLREIAREPITFADTYWAADAKGVDIQHILYGPDDLHALLGLYDTAQIPEQSYRAIFVLGRHRSQQMSKPADLDVFLKALGNRTLNWSVCAFGRNEQACLLSALNAGGHARIGFENNRMSPNGTVFPDNATSVASFVDAAATAGFQPKAVKQ